MEKIPLYGGEVVLCFNPRNHTYWLDGHPKDILPNATGVLKALAKPQLIGWAARMASEHWYDAVTPGEVLDEVQCETILENAKLAHKTYTGGRGNIGTLVHNLCEEAINHYMGLNPYPKDPVNPHVLNGFRAFEGWVAGLPDDIQWLMSERITYHRENGHCGTIDAAWRQKSALDIIHYVDFKTGSGIWPEAALQLSSYAAALSYEMDWPFVDGQTVRDIIHLDINNGKAKLWDEARISSKLTGYGLSADYRQFLTLLDTYKWIMGGPNKWSFLKA